MLSIRKLNDHTVVECGFAKKQMPRAEREDFASELLQNWPHFGTISLESFFVPNIRFDNKIGAHINILS
jgi:hypothetical protein